MTLFDRFKKVKAFVFDVDGVLTDGRVLVMENGEQLRTFHTKDGYALQLAVKHQYPVLIITGGKSLGVKSRMEALGIRDVYMDVSDKENILATWMKQYGLDWEDVLFMGDDVPDLTVMKKVGMPVCPSDAIEDVKHVCAYISPRCGGVGAVRDVIERVMRLKDQWNQDPTLKST